VKGDGAIGPEESFRYGSVLAVREALEDGAVERDLGVDPFLEDLVEMFLMKLIEGDMDLKVFQDVLHRDHPENKQL